MSTTTFEAELASNQPNNVFKALGGLIYTAATSVAIPAAFTNGATSDMVTISSTNWKRLGLLTKGDGVTFSRDMNTDEEEAWGVQRAGQDRHHVGRDQRGLHSHGAASRGAGDVRLRGPVGHRA
jgi:hypothetical protein